MLKPEFSSVTNSYFLANSVDFRSTRTG